MSEAFVHSVCGQAWRGGGRLTPKPDALLAKGVELARDFDGRRIVAGAAVPGRQPGHSNWCPARPPDGRSQISWLKAPISE